MVERSVAPGHAGIECLSGIPGYVGATPIQNVGAYGQEIGESVVAVRALDRATRATRVFDNETRAVFPTAAASSRGRFATGTSC